MNHILAAEYKIVWEWGVPDWMDSLLKLEPPVERKLGIRQRGTKSGSSQGKILAVLTCPATTGRGCSQQLGDVSFLVDDQFLKWRYSWVFLLPFQYVCLVTLILSTYWTLIVTLFTKQIKHKYNVILTLTWGVLLSSVYRETQANWNLRW